MSNGSMSSRGFSPRKDPVADSDALFNFIAETYKKDKKIEI